MKPTGSKEALPKKNPSELKEGFVGDRREPTDPFDSASPAASPLFALEQSAIARVGTARWSHAYSTFWRQRLSSSPRQSLLLLPAVAVLLFPLSGSGC